MDFIHPRRGRRTLHEMIAEIQSYVHEEPTESYKVVIGTDSQTREHSTVFVSAVIVQRIGKGAIFYYQRNRYKAIRDLRYRIYQETEYSLKCVDALKESGFFSFSIQLPMEIHLDIGQKGETRKLIQEVVGWVTAVGYTAKIKPESYAASAVADRFTK
ncbi:ribonuclease H-like YkuK family protein [Hazenella sp. IB182357]|uniref:Ribonuclease H-like YkuK family protein n=1 Tax=Polycladospora coralii TaxID=2771432 RepID=A0A926N9X1_9BACL|nr:ribonuclease H-like YkuK family protein [Polycladospora coralii]MBD1372473.1 ribonuclease H-like YkuK family protein [Polycladospora coralii]MBS7531795.1 ribonuclease H-like YkuK family protein [Polycladospora coralii]